MTSRLHSSIMAKVIISANYSFSGNQTGAGIMKHRRAANLAYGVCEYINCWTIPQRKSRLKKANLGNSSIFKALKSENKIQARSRFSRPRTNPAPYIRSHRSGRPGSQTWWSQSRPLSGAGQGESCRVSAATPPSSRGRRARRRLRWPT